MGRARDAACLIVTDALFPPVTDAAIVREVIAASDFILLNSDELAALTGTKDVQSGVASLRAGTKATIVTKRGAKGARLDTVTSTSERSAPTVEAIDSTGAGDAFAAALITALLRSMDLDEALAMAVKAGAIAVQSLGSVTRLPRFEQL